MGRQKKIKDFIDYYNNKRYHAGINYLKPADIFFYNSELILAERKRKLGEV